MCWIWRHKWSKWAHYGIIDLTYTHLDLPGKTFQDGKLEVLVKSCSKCGLKKYRRVKQ